MPTVYVDDGTLECVGTRRSAVAATVTATRVACKGLEEIRMMLSRTKKQSVGDAEADWVGDSGRVGRMERQI